MLFRRGHGRVHLRVVDEHSYRVHHGRVVDKRWLSSSLDVLARETEREFEGNAIPLEQANPTLWAKIQRAKADAAQGERRS